MANANRNARPLFLLININILTLPTILQAFPSAALVDSADYYCEASNMAGPSQSCMARKMEVRKSALLLFLSGVLGNKPYFLFFSII